MLRFYDGGSRERDILTKAYLRLIKHVNSIYKVRIPSAPSFFSFFIFPSFLHLLTACSHRSGSHTSGQKTTWSSIYGPQLAMRSLLTRRNLTTASRNHWTCNSSPLTLMRNWLLWFEERPHTSLSIFSYLITDHHFYSTRQIRPWADTTHPTFGAIIIYSYQNRMFSKAPAPSASQHSCFYLADTIPSCRRFSPACRCWPQRLLTMAQYIFFAIPSSPST